MSLNAPRNQQTGKAFWCTLVVKLGSSTEWFVCAMCDKIGEMKPWQKRGAIHVLFKVKETSLSLLIVIPKQVFKTFVFPCSKHGCLLRSMWLFPVFWTVEDMLMPTDIFKHSVRLTRVPVASFNYNICHFWQQSQYPWPWQSENWITPVHAYFIVKMRPRVLETEDHP